MNERKMEKIDLQEARSNISTSMTYRSFGMTPDNLRAQNGKGLERKTTKRKNMGETYLIILEIIKLSLQETPR